MRHNGSVLLIREMKDFSHGRRSHLINVPCRLSGLLELIIRPTKFSTSYTLNVQECSRSKHKINRRRRIELYYDLRVRIYVILVMLCVKTLLINLFSYFVPFVNFCPLYIYSIYVYEK